MTRDQAPQGDREKLAREMYAKMARDAYASITEVPLWDNLNEKVRQRWLNAADIAIAYADRRVAEAVTEVERICGEWGCNPKFTLLLTSALSPALKPNRREPTSEDAHWRDEYPMKYEPSMEEKAVARYWKLKEGGQADE